MMLKSKWVKIVFDINVMTLNILYWDFNIPWINFKLEDILTKNSRKILILSYLLQFKQILDKYYTCTISPTCTHLHRLLKYANFFWIFLCQHKLLGFLYQCVLKCLWFFLSKSSKLVYSFESLTLNWCRVHSVPLDGASTLREFSKAQVFWATSNPRTRNWPLENSNFEAFKD